MSYLEELKNLVDLHAKSQGLNSVTYHQVMDSITTLGGENAGEWTNELGKQGDLFFNKKNYLLATQYYNLARFPFINNQAKLHIHNKCLITFQHWYESKNPKKIQKNPKKIKKNQKNPKKSKKIQKNPKKIHVQTQDTPL